MSSMLSAPEHVSVKAPHRLDQIRATFGDIFAYLCPEHSLDPRWQAERMITVALPFPLVLSWDHSRQVTRMTCHKLMESIRSEHLCLSGHRRVNWWASIYTHVRV